MLNCWRTKKHCKPVLFYRGIFFFGSLWAWWCKVSGCLSDQIHHSTSWHASIRDTSLSLWVQMKLYPWQRSRSSTRTRWARDNWNQEMWEMFTCTASTQIGCKKRDTIQTRLKVFIENRVLHRWKIDAVKAVCLTKIAISLQADFCNLRVSAQFNSE